jgi:hypothetical protein
LRIVERENTVGTPLRTGKSAATLNDATTLNESLYDRTIPQICKAFLKFLEVAEVDFSVQLQEVVALNTLSQILPLIADNQWFHALFLSRGRCSRCGLCCRSLTQNLARRFSQLCCRLHSKSGTESEV